MRLFNHEARAHSARAESRIFFLDSQGRRRWVAGRKNQDSF